MSICKYCNEDKPEKDYTRKNKVRCKACRRIHLYEWRKKHPELMRAADARRRAKPEVRQARAVAARKRILANPSKETERQRIYRATHPEYVDRQREKALIYAANNREKRLSYQLTKQAEKKSIIDSFKNKPCMDCGQQFPVYVMDFDHVRDDKKDTIANMHKNRSIKDIMEEIAKCELVCANCHRIRTQNRIDSGRVAPLSL